MSTVRRTAKTTGGNTFTGDQILGSETASRALTLNGSGKITSSSVTDTELGYLSGVTSSIQSQISGISSFSDSVSTLRSGSGDLGRPNNICTSSDGSVIYAIEGYVSNSNKIYKSANSGTSWSEVSDADREYRAIACDSDGSVVVAVVNSGQIYVSTDSGSTWTARDSSRAWISVTVSNDGSIMAAAVDGGQIYVSSDTGATWGAVDSSRDWRDISCSGDGTKMVAVAAGGQVYNSTDSGSTWTARDSTRAWISCDISDDGSIAYATVVVTGTQGVYVSYDSGATWALAYGATLSTAVSVVTSSDGSVACATYSSSKVLISTNYGLTWRVVSVGLYFYSLAIPDSGSFFLGSSLGYVRKFTLSTSSMFSVGSGTDYSLTNSYARVDFGTIDCQIKLPVFGAYLITATIALNGTTADDSVFFKLYDATAAVDVPKSETDVTSGNTNEKRVVVLQAHYSVETASAIQIYGYNATAARGSVDAPQTRMSFIRIA